jgi:hypothetical protein
MRIREAFLDPSSTTTAVKNVIGHVTDVLQPEFKHSTAIGAELSKETILCVAVYNFIACRLLVKKSTRVFKLVKREVAAFKVMERKFSLNTSTLKK